MLVYGLVLRAHDPPMVCGSDVSYLIPSYLS